jgi:hypothetical protein
LLSPIRWTTGNRSSQSKGTIASSPRNKSKVVNMQFDSKEGKKGGSPQVQQPPALAAMVTPGEELTADLQRNSVNRTRFTPLFDGRHCSVGVRDGRYGLHEIRFVLKLLPGRELKTIAEALAGATNEVNNALTRVTSLPKGHTFKVYRGGGSERLKTVIVARPLTMTFTPVVMGSGSRNGEAHAKFLSDFGLLPVPSTVLRIAVGAFRVKMGFPARENKESPQHAPDEANENETESLSRLIAKIGSPSDPGDLLQGYDVRTAFAPRGSSVKTQRDGVRGSFAWHMSHESLLVAGAVPSDDLRIFLGE